MRTRYHISSVSIDFGRRRYDTRSVQNACDVETQSIEVARGSVRSNNATGGCYTAESTCKRQCDAYEKPYKTPVACVKRVDAGPQVDAATPEDGRPGGACNKVGEKCFVAICECNNGSMLTPVTAPCSNGICQGQAEACPPACNSRGGWSGKGQD